MTAKTVFIILFTAIITIFLVINTDAVEFNFLVDKVNISKLVVIGVCTLIGFVLGFIAGKPKRTYSSYDDHAEVVEVPAKSALSDEDKDYIS
ncbi:LapA family protein [Pedobacter duraquae]|uniref:Uncharacterized protein DUF1049 n=1 Tax=Pedobacter duraquae TaxID=425511 RepID=A0A4R6IR76_9SPHI|nr:LapA family protein [Pedobacter duraquae]TDO24737.1 uncharacterized protein DUF1049 [Pedobacter duraquae]